jgi:hypothetical protein
MPTVTLTSVASGMSMSGGSAYVSPAPSWYYPVCNIYLVTIEFSQSEVPIGCVPRALPSYSYPGGGPLFPIGSSPYWDFGPALGKGWASPNLCRLEAVASPTSAWPSLYSETDSAAMIYAPSGESDIAHFNYGYTRSQISIFEKFTGTATNSSGFTAAAVDRYYILTNLYKTGDSSTIFDDSENGAISVGINDATGILAGIFGSTNYFQLIIDDYSESYNQSLRPVYAESGNVYLNTRPVPSIQRDWTYPDFDHRNQHKARLISHTNGTPDSQNVVMRCGTIPLSAGFVSLTNRLNFTIGSCVFPGVSTRAIIPSGGVGISGTTHKIYWYNAVGKLINPGGTAFAGTVIGQGTQWYETGLVTPPAGAVYWLGETSNSGTSFANAVYFYEQPCPAHWATIHGDWCPGNYLKLPVTAADFP